MTSPPIVALWVAAGSAIGGVLRYGCTDVMTRLTGPDFPWGTIAVNVAGSFVIGFFAAVSGPDGRWAAGPAARQFVASGLLGGFTTFSAFSLQTVTLAQDGAWLLASANVIGSVAPCLVAAGIGHALGLVLNR